MTTKALLRKEQLIAQLRETRASILAEASALSVERQNEVFLGIWSIKDLLAHLAGWDHANMEAASYVMAGKLPAFYAHHDREWAKYNAMLVAKYKRDDMNELMDLLKESQRQLIEAIQSVPAGAFNKDFGVRFRGYKVTVQRLLEAELKDEQTHLKQMTDFFEEAH